MRRFSLFQRGKVYYVQFLNPETHSMTTAKSTGARTRDEAAVVVADWLRNGIPTQEQNKTTLVADCLTLNTVLAGIRRLPLGPEEAVKIVEALKERGLIENATLKQGPSSVLLSDFLLEFWDWEEADRRQRSFLP